ncbi:hypothetical protein ACIQNU_16220 [Streptomyces sp. NPDC091292]|uniref:DUF7848 domain-containing protein n=1 Tax=Streptomyces sp. NPDC091292 TaxID=3365991 RepID=UPI0037FB5104
MSTYGYIRWLLRPDLDDDAPPHTYAFRCLTLIEGDGDDRECDAKSPVSTDPTEPQTWAFAHLRDHPDHTSYAEVTEHPWVMWRGGPA